MYDYEPQPREKKVETSLVVKDDYQGGAVVYEEIIVPKTGETWFIDHMGIKHKEVYFNDITYVPIPGSHPALEKAVVKISTGIMEYDSTKDLIEDIQAHIHTYLEVNPRYEKIASWYVLFSWIYDRLDVVPYLRTRGDTGVGKSRFLDVIGGLCYKPMFLSGAVTPAVIYRVQEIWRGTLIIDEGDWYKSDATNEIIKILNCGYQRGRPVPRCQKDNPDNIQYFDTFGPKILATRKDFIDKATENRCITHINREMTRTDIPINLPKSFYEEQENLRKKLLKWRLDNWNKIDPDRAQTLGLEVNLSPRLRQVMEGFPLLFHDDPETMKFFKVTLLGLNNEMKEERSASYDGMIVNTLLSLIDEGYTDITPGIIANRMKEKYGLERVTPQSIGKHLKSLGLRTQPPKRVGGELKRCLELDPVLIKQLRMRYQIDTGEPKDDISTLDEWDTTCNTPSTEETVTSVTSVTNDTGTKGGITKNNNIYTSPIKDSEGPGTPHRNVTNVTHVTPQKKKQLHVDNGISIEDKNNGNKGEGVSTSSSNLHVQRTALHDAIIRHSKDGQAVHYATLRDDRELMQYFPSEGELYRFIDDLLEKKDGGICKPCEGYLRLKNREAT